MKNTIQDLRFPTGKLTLGIYILKFWISRLSIIKE